MARYEGKMYSDRQTSPPHRKYLKNFSENSKNENMRYKTDEKGGRMFYKNCIDTKSSKKKGKHFEDDEKSERSVSCERKNENKYKIMHGKENAMRFTNHYCKEENRDREERVERKLHRIKHMKRRRNSDEESDTERRKNRREKDEKKLKIKENEMHTCNNSIIFSSATSDYSFHSLKDSCTISVDEAINEEEKLKRDKEKQKEEESLEKKLEEEQDETIIKKDENENKENKNENKMVGNNYDKRIEEKKENDRKSSKGRSKIKEKEIGRNDKRSSRHNRSMFKSFHTCRKLRGKSRSVDSKSTSSSDYERSLEKSRSRERQRIRTQYSTIQRYCKTNDSQVFWDGFQWVSKNGEVEGGEGVGMAYDQQMNATRRARRLHIGNLPLFMNVKENDFRDFLWNTMQLNNLCQGDLTSCPILHIWFARDRGGNFGFMEMQTVEDAHNALKLDGVLWNGVPVRINRPTDWKKTVSTHAIDVLASTSNLAVAESLAAAAQQAATTGNSAGLVSLVNQLPVQQQQAIVEVMNQHILPNVQERNMNASLPLDFVKEKIKSDLLNGVPSRIVRILKPALDLNGIEEYEEVLNDIKDECSKYGAIMSALMISPSIKQKLFSVLADIGDVFFEFATTLQADSCILNMSGRMYDKKPVKMIRFDESIFVEKLKPFAQNLFLKVLEAVH